jgi:hypothetical protein
METIGKQVRESIRQYWKGRSPEEMNKVSKGRPKYTKKYFDGLEEENFGDVTELENL